MVFYRINLTTFGYFCLNWVCFWLSLKMKQLIIFLIFGIIVFTGCKKKFCGKIFMISSEISSVDGKPLYKLYLESGEIVPMRSRGNYQVGEGYCND